MWNSSFPALTTDLHQKHVNDIIKACNLTKIFYHQPRNLRDIPYTVKMCLRGIPYMVKNNHSWWVLMICCLSNTYQDTYPKTTFTLYTTKVKLIHVEHGSSDAETCLLMDLPCRCFAGGGVWVGWVGWDGVGEGEGGGVGGGGGGRKRLLIQKKAAEITLIYLYITMICG